MPTSWGAGTNNAGLNKYANLPGAGTNNAALYKYANPLGERVYQSRWRSDVIEAYSELPDDLS
jgi:hypothetical protein